MTKNEDRINKLFKELVPDTGKADSLAGELVRAMSRIGYRFTTTATSWASATAMETCNPAGRSLEPRATTNRKADCRCLGSLQ